MPGSRASTSLEFQTCSVPRLTPRLGLPSPVSRLPLSSQAEATTTRATSSVSQRTVFITANDAVPAARAPALQQAARLGEVAGHRMALAPVDQRRFLLGADVLGLPAAGPEPAARRRAHRAGHVALEHDPAALALQLGVGDGHGRQQRLGVGMAGPLVDVVAGADLD